MVVGGVAAILCETKECILTRSLENHPNDLKVLQMLGYCFGVLGNLTHLTQESLFM